MKREEGNNNPVSGEDDILLSARFLENKLMDAMNRSALAGRMMTEVEI